MSLETKRNLVWRIDWRLWNDGRPVGTRTPDLYRVDLSFIGFATTYKTAGTAKVRGSHIRPTFCGLGCGLEIRERNVRLLEAPCAALDLPLNDMIA